MRDRLEELRSKIQSDSQPIEVGAVFPGTWEDRQKAHEELMKFLHEGGNDSRGREGLEKAMRRLGR